MFRRRWAHARLRFFYACDLIGEGRGLLLVSLVLLVALVSLVSLITLLSLSR